MVLLFSIFDTVYFTVSILTENRNPQLLQWTINFEEVWNPLKKQVAWICAVIGAFLLIWFCIFRPALYPKFGSFKKSVLISQNGIIIRQFNVVFKGARKVIFANEKVKQSAWDRIVRGEIRTIIIPNPVLQQPLTFYPRKKNAGISGLGYSARPNPIPRNGVATITYPKDHIEIKLS